MLIERPSPLSSRLARAAAVLVTSVALAVPALLAGTPAQAQEALDPPGAVSVPGTFGAQVGCPGDFQPECEQIQLVRRDVDGVWQLTLDLEPGEYEYKAAIDRSFDENYGLGGEFFGPNIPLTVGADQSPVTFYYDPVSHWVTTDADAPIVTAFGDFQSELGCPGDFAPDCLRSWLQDLDGDGVYTFTTEDLPAGDYVVKVSLGLSFDVNYGADGEPSGPDIPFTIPTDNAKVTFTYVAATNLVTVLAGDGLPTLADERGYWLARSYLAWQPTDAERVAGYRLYAAPDGGMTATPDGIEGGTSYALELDPAGLPTELREGFPAQAELPALRLTDDAPVEDLLTGQLIVAALDADGALVDATGLQVPGVLDDVYAAAADATLGLTWSGDAPTAAVWAPTAKDVSLLVYDSGQDGDPVQTVAMDRSPDGVWTVAGDPTWKGRYFLFQVDVYVNETRQVERNLVTDPYSYGLSRNSLRSLFVDLADPDLLPTGWAGQRKPALADPVDQAITELHVRDFSAEDETVPAAERGTYLAFTAPRSDGRRVTQALSRAGTTTVHLLPSFDIATQSIDEDKSTWQTPDCDLPSFPPDSAAQQECVSEVTGSDGFNWGYDPMHYTTPEGSYATDAEGAARTLQFRQMVASLNSDGLRVVTDMVFNHTADSGQTGVNNLDRIVPGYYHRLDADGNVTSSSCCPDTASEHLMMGKLLIDSTLTWATAYKVDGFRFDLMSFTPKTVMVELRDRLDALTPAEDGVDGKSVYVYGEGWNFGTAADDRLFVQATQANMAGTGIGTFNDRLRDGVRGGNFNDEDPRAQGFGSGLFTDPNGAPVNGDTEAQRAELGLSEDQIKVGLVGNLTDYAFTDWTGASVTGADIDYNGEPAGYNAEPQEAVTYVSAHDNETLYDALAYKLPQRTRMLDRVRMQNVSLATTAFSQGVTFWHSGSEALRSKSFDGNSFNAGDWWNALDPSLQDNGFGKGLPLAEDNEQKWPFMRPLLADPALKPSPGALLLAADQSRTLLSIRREQPLLHLGSAELIQQKVSFPGSGPGSTPGVIVERIDDTVGPDSDPARKGLVIVFNATPQPTTQTVPGTAGEAFSLHPRQAGSADRVLRTSRFDAATGSFTVPPRSVAVFEQR